MRGSWKKLPGLYYPHEFEQVIRPAVFNEQGPPGDGDDWYFEKAGADDRGKPLFAVFSRPHEGDGEEVKSNG